MKTIKRILLGLTLGLLLTSCSTEELRTEGSCGIVNGTGTNYANDTWYSYPAVMQVDIISDETGDLEEYFLYVESREEDDYLHSLLVPYNNVCMTEIIAISNQYN